MTLFNFIGAILHEITFYGTPSNRDKVGDDLAETGRKLDAGELELFEWKKDENGKHYFEDKDGNRDYIFDKKDE